MASLRLHAVSKSFGATPVLRDVELDIADGEFVVFVGPSGCGKSTLLRCIAGLEDASSGDIVIDGERVNDVAPSRRGLAMVFQSYALYPHMTVAENMAFGLRMARLPKPEIERAVAEAAAMLELTPLLDRLPAQLSGGQRQRVAIGRAIVRRPGIFLFDEPLSNLDAALRTQTRMEIARLHRTLATTTIYVTHDQAEAMTLADRIVVLNAGRVEQQGPPLALYRRPANVFVAGFLGSPRINFLGGVVDAGMVKLDDGGSIAVDIDPTAVRAGDRVTLGIRPEQLIVGNRADHCRLDATIELVEHLGDFAYVRAVTAQGTALVARTSDDEGLQVGGRAVLAFRASDVLVFDAAGQALR